jgi:ribosomal protein S3
LISGKVPSSRAKSWRFYQGYLKKCGDIALVGVKRSYKIARLKTGVVGIKVSLMPPDIRLPDDIKLLSEKEEVIEEVTKEGDKEKEDKTESKSTEKDPEAKKEKKEDKKKETKGKEDKKDSEEDKKEKVKE